MKILPKAIYRFNSILIKIPMAFFKELEQKKLQLVWKHKRPWRATAILRNENGTGGIRSLTSDYIYHKRYSNQDSVVLTHTHTQKYGSMEQDRKPRDKPMHLIYDKGGKSIQWRKDSLFKKCCSENQTAAWKRMKLQHSLTAYMGFPGSSDGKASAYNAGDPGSIPGSERSPGEGNGNPLQYSCLENPMDWGAWEATAHGVAKSQTLLSDFTFKYYL